MRTIARLLPLSLALAACASSAATTPQADDLDTFVRAQMARRQVPGLSLAIIQDGRIVEARAYGVTAPGGRDSVTTTTLFQAGSISKSVSALGALKLVEQGKLDLDADVNRSLKSWQVPANRFTAVKPVTLRGLLSHTAGLTVHGFPGYAVDVPVPTLVQVLNGTPPTNTPAIVVDTTPGAIWRYSGGGYTVMQQMMIDVTGQPFPQYMRDNVLQPIGMMHSSFEQPLPPAMFAMTAAGQYPGGVPVKGRSHIYPEMAAAGLWTTPSDLARFAIEVQGAYTGRASNVISPAMTRRMLTVEKENDGLGVFLQGKGRSLLFNHNGRDDGFDASLNAFAETGQGLAVMINANDNSGMIGRIIAFVAKKYAWPGLESSYVPPVASAAPAAEQLRAYTGRYELSNNNMLTLIALDGRLYTASSGLPDEEMVPVASDRFASMDRDVKLGFVRDASGAISALTWTRGSNTRTAPRIGPLVSNLSRQSDPDPAFTARVDAALRAMVQGGAAVASAPALTAGAQRDFSRFGPWAPAEGYRGITFIGSEDVSSRALERHGHPVARVVYYTLTTESGQRGLMVHVTKEGLITDFDDVVD